MKICKWDSNVQHFTYIRQRPVNLCEFLKPDFRFLFPTPRRNRILLLNHLGMQVQTMERGIKVVRHYPAKLREFLIFNFKFSITVLKMIRKVLFLASRLLRKDPVTIRIIDSHPELSGKFTKVSHIGYQIQIDHLKIH
ncbi:hypothetical protein TNCV_5017331 [Trichonephila clavipes]|nr:hypothetical protein TNCV_5017331 [Trichonephila clavipes]